MHKFGVRLIKNKLYPLSFPDSITLQHDQLILVRTDAGEEVTKALRIPCCVFQKWGDKLPEPVPLIRILSAKEKDQLKELKEKENIAFQKCRELVEEHQLCLRLIDTKYTFDRKKLTFYFKANTRIDFRGLLRDLTQLFRKVRIDLRHIGVRDETALLEGVGICGKEYCCCSRLKQFPPINIKIAKDQGMPINPGKISGTCGRLLCCLNYEYSNYLDAAVGMPPVGSAVMTPDGIGRVCALRFLSNNIAVKLEDGKVKDYGKSDIEMIDEEVSNIKIDYPPTYQQQEEEQVDVSQLEDDENSFTSNI